MADRQTSRVTLHVITNRNIRELDEGELEELFCWIDKIPLSRPKRNVTRDFSDGVLMAECLKHFLPRLIELHNYPSASSLKMKETNWYQLDRRVLNKIGIQMAPAVIQSVIACKPRVIEYILAVVRDNINLELCTRRAKRPPEELPDWANTSASIKGGRPRENRSQAGRPSCLEDRTYSPSGERKQTGHNESLQGVHRQDHLKTATKTVHRSFLDERQNEIDLKDENIQILAAKIERLEHLVRLKDLRIEELSTRIDDLNQCRQTRPRDRAPPTSLHRPARIKTTVPPA